MFESPRAILIKVGRRMSKLSGKEKLATKDGEDGRTDSRRTWQESSRKDEAIR